MRLLERQPLWLPQVQASLPRIEIVEERRRSHDAAFRGGRGHLLKLLFWSGQGLVLYAKRLERGHFVWPILGEGAVSLTPAQLAMLVEGIDWRAPVRTWRPTADRLRVQADFAWRDAAACRRLPACRSTRIVCQATLPPCRR